MCTIKKKKSVISNLKIKIYLAAAETLFKETLTNKLEILKVKSIQSVPNFQSIFGVITSIVKWKTVQKVKSKNLLNNWILCFKEKFCIIKSLE